jgi:hypothetical protein
MPLSVGQVLISALHTLYLDLGLPWGRRNHRQILGPALRGRQGRATMWLVTVARAAEILL